MLNHRRGSACPIRYVKELTLDDPCLPRHRESPWDMINNVGLPETFRRTACIRRSLRVCVTLGDSSSREQSPVARCLLLVDLPPATPVLNR